MNIGYLHCEINNASSYFFPSQDVENSIASVKSASTSKLSKGKGLCIYIFFSVLSTRSEKLSGVLTLTGVLLYSWHVHNYVKFY